MSDQLDKNWRDNIALVTKAASQKLQRLCFVG